MVDTPLGRGQALFLIDYGMHQNTCWVVAMHKNGIVKHFDSNDIIISPNYTYHINQEKHSNIRENATQKNGAQNPATKNPS